jgi:hypothetical protein
VPFAASMYAVGPLIAFGVVAALTAILRWTFNSEISRTEQRIFSSTESDDFGLLSVAAVVESADDARAFQRMLADAGIRATTAAAPANRVRVLVFTSDLERARRVMGVGGSAV